MIGNSKQLSQQPQTCSSDTFIRAQNLVQTCPILLATACVAVLLWSLPIQAQWVSSPKQSNKPKQHQRCQSSWVWILDVTRSLIYFAYNALGSFFSTSELSDWAGNLQREQLYYEPWPASDAPMITTHSNSKYADKAMFHPSLSRPSSQAHLWSIVHLPNDSSQFACDAGSQT